MHDGSSLHLYKLDENLDPFNRRSAINTLEDHRDSGSILTGLIYMDKDSRDLHDVLETSQRPLNQLGSGDLCPGNKMLEKFPKPGQAYNCMIQLKIAYQRTDRD